MQTLVVGTRNPDKLREIEEILLGVPLRLRALPDDVPEAVEDGATLEANAELKARHYALHTGALCLADDTGLEVDALGGAPGIRTARFAGAAAGYADNRRALLEALRDVPPARRAARFRCVVALARPSGEVFARAEGRLEGAITGAERGASGFGYDPIFAAAGDGRTLAEMRADEKNVLSHRARALEALRPRLLELL